MVKLASKLNGTVVSLKKAPSKGKRILISFSKSHKSYGFMIDNFIVIIYLWIYFNTDFVPYSPSFFIWLNKKIILLSVTLMTFHNKIFPRIVCNLKFATKILNTFLLLINISFIYRDIVDDDYFKRWNRISSQIIKRKKCLCQDQKCVVVKSFKFKQFYIVENLVENEYFVIFSRSSFLKYVWLWFFLKLFLMFS